MIAYRISEESGKPFQEALSDVPAEAQRMFADLRGRADDAMERGREMYMEKQEEMGERLQEDAPIQ